MQRVRFRAWDKEEKVMREVVQINFTEEKVWCVQYYLNDWKFSEVILMQYTGLKDKNGNEICEGDICKGYITNTDKIFVIEKRIDPEFIGFVPVEVNQNQKSISFFQRWDYLEIIGNIYQNKDLIK